MPLPPSTATREHLHTRTMRVDAYARDDGQWDLEAELIDVKGYDFPKHDGSIHVAGQPVHHMHLRVTIDASFTITEALAAYDAAPYKEHCFCIAPDYKDLVGMNLLKGFRNAVKARFGRTAGCTHLSELSYILPTAAVQAMAGRRRKQAGTENNAVETEDKTRSTDPAKRPFHIDGCHALRVDSPMTLKFYPQWYVKSSSPGEDDKAASGSAVSAG
ncbi:DUF2889 domain-containing protein [Neopusillimonas aromaticivorans]|uniref:DUF2889 domain-containing protein n=1 Tax=Neopusillimonas aromaticivorans TaxID=2979868 RepID=UPI002591A279|nr:DUF2889 domain-containing protein [Neopusillimonas aromaticivorans]WJJ93789.1 DUF2889 domain-containing protein [Neopusillimonas aromaticivorans]